VDDCVQVRVGIAMGDVKHRLNNHAYEMCAAGRVYSGPSKNRTHVEDGRSNSILVDKGGRCALYAGHKCLSVHRSSLAVFFLQYPTHLQVLVPEMFLMARGYNCSSFTHCDHIYCCRWPRRPLLHFLPPWRSQRLANRLDITTTDTIWIYLALTLQNECTHFMRRARISLGHFSKSKVAVQIQRVFHCLFRENQLRELSSLAWKRQITFKQSP
jgi:hypothetical protein